MVLGAFLGRGIITGVGFVWPAYQCFKDIESRKDNLLRWCVYWTVLALYTAVERFLDNFLFWLPLYNEVKIGFVYFLAQAGGAEYVYSTFVQPLLLDHEGKIDEAALQTRAWLVAHVQNNVGWLTTGLQAKAFQAYALLQGIQQKEADRSATYAAGDSRSVAADGKRSRASGSGGRASASGGVAASPKSSSWLRSRRGGGK